MVPTNNTAPATINISPPGEGIITMVRTEISLFLENVPGELGQADGHA